jgi:hypothetical protein
LATRMRLRISTSVLLGLLLSIVVDHHRHGVTAWLYGPSIRTAYWPTTGCTGVRSSRASIRVVPNDPSRFPRNTCLAAQLAHFRLTSKMEKSIKWSDCPVECNSERRSCNDHQSCLSPDRNSLPIDNLPGYGGNPVLKHL